MTSTAETDFSPTDLPLNLVSLQQLKLEADDGHDEISDKVDSIVFEKRYISFFLFVFFWKILSTMNIHCQDLAKT